MQSKINSILIRLGISLFCGIIILSIGVGSVYTPLNKVAGPIVCGNRQLEIVQNRYSYRPDDTTWTITAYCVDNATNSRQENTLLVQIVSGTIYGLILFGFTSIAFVWLSFGKKNSAAEAGKTISGTPGFPAAVPEKASSESIEKRLLKLKQLHDDNLITDQEFKEKGAEILDDL